FKLLNLLTWWKIYTMKYLFLFLLVGLVSCGDVNEELKEKGKHTIKKHFDTGEILEEQYLNGKKEGISKKWYKNGKLKSEANYKGGKKEGPCKNWYSNGQLKSEFVYKDGKYDGIHREWHENGQLKSKRNYKRGKQYGIWRMWYENGQLVFEADCNESKFDGLYRGWYENGKLESEKIYQNNVLISEKCWDGSGIEIECPKY
ncbi:MAG: toxin-antitoxin system YwqK family antitoxin, partial [Crocinitomicaceae bacterium]|nr:toxin-antitoxin system YwqK family antitoxin [Crocinitomicaceae bacterium]